MDSAPAGFANGDAHRHALGDRAFRYADPLDQIVLLPRMAFAVALVATAITTAKERARWEADLRADRRIIDLHDDLFPLLGNADRLGRRSAASRRGAVGRPASGATENASAGRWLDRRRGRRNRPGPHREDRRARLSRRWSRGWDLRPGGAGAGYAEQGKQNSFHIELHVIENR
jgi:hypothetical protein